MTEQEVRKTISLWEMENYENRVIFSPGMGAVRIYKGLSMGICTLVRDNFNKDLYAETSLTIKLKLKHLKI